MATVTVDQNDNKETDVLSNSQDRRRQGNKDSQNDSIELARFNAVFSSLYSKQNNEQQQQNVSQKHAQNRNQNRNAHTVPVHQNNLQKQTHVLPQPQPQPQQQIQQMQTQDTNDDDDTIMISSQTGEDKLDAVASQITSDFLKDRTDESESGSQSNTSTGDSSNQSENGGSDQSVGYSLAEADQLYFIHYYQEKWMTPFNESKISHILYSDRIKDPESVFAFIIYLRLIFEHPRHHNIAKNIIDEYPVLVETRCAQIFSCTSHALYKFTENKDDVFLLYPNDDDLYYTKLAMQIDLPTLRSVVSMRLNMLGKIAGKPNEANNLFDDYVPPISIDLTGDTTEENNNRNNAQNNADINMGARVNQNQGSKIQNKDQQINLSQNIGSKKLNKDRNSRAMQTGFENDLLRMSSLSTKPRIGNIGISPTNIRRDNERSNVRNDIRSEIEQHQREIERLKALSSNNNGLSGNINNNTHNIPQGTGNSNNNNNNNSGISRRRVLFQEDKKYDTDNERIERTDVAIDELNKLIGREMFKEATTLNFKYDGSDKTPGNSLHYLNQIDLWYTRCRTSIFNSERADINSPSTQLVLTQALTKTLSQRTRVQFKQRQLKSQTVENWLQRFDEIISIEDDFTAHFELLKNFKPPKDTKIEKYIPVFKDAKTVHDMILPRVERSGKVSNIQHYKFKDAEAIYEAAVSNMNQKIISEVRKYLFDHFDSIDWSYLTVYSPGYQPEKTQNINNIDVLHTGILNLAKYTRDIRSNDKAGTKHINDSILEYSIMEPQSTKKKYEDDHATHIGNQVNAIDRRPRGNKYDKNKYKGGHRRNQPWNGRSQSYLKRRDKMKNDFKRNYDQSNYRNKRRNMKGFTTKTININNWQGEVYNIKPNSQAKQHFDDKQLTYFSRNEECRVCPRSDSKRFGHSSAWHNYLKNYRPGAMKKLSTMYFGSNKKRKRNKNNHANAIDDRKRLSNLSQNGRGRSKTKNKDKNKNKNKDKRGKTNTVGALAVHNDETDRGGIISSGNNTFGNTNNQVLNDQIEVTREHNSNMLAALQAVKNDNKSIKQAKASNGGTLLSFTTQSRREETDSNL